MHDAVHVQIEIVDFGDLSAAPAREFSCHVRLVQHITGTLTLSDWTTWLRQGYRSLIQR
jgi:hypothetical protein